MHARQYGIGPLAGERQLVLEEDMHVAQVGLEQDVEQPREALPPRIRFRRAGAVAVDVDEAIRQSMKQRFAENLFTGGGDGFTKQVGLPGSTV
ncbi:hypothetical protein [Streptomyces sp. SAI-170]|uniref:hypothetical protein n=1 Tax=Streptomyces sp. SAI-170 TaxID=3377729 RepID=UPI003C7E8FD8